MLIALVIGWQYDAERAHAHALQNAQSRLNHLTSVIGKINDSNNHLKSLLADLQTQAHTITKSAEALHDGTFYGTLSTEQEIDLSARETGTASDLRTTVWKIAKEDADSLDSYDSAGLETSAARKITQQRNGYLAACSYHLWRAADESHDRILSSISSQTATYDDIVAQFDAASTAADDSRALQSTPR